MSLLLALLGAAPHPDDPSWRLALPDDSWQPDDDFEEFLTGLVEAPALVDDSETRAVFSDDWQPEFDDDQSLLAPAIEDSTEWIVALAEDWSADDEWADELLWQIIEDAVIVADDPETRMVISEDWIEEYDEDDGSAVLGSLIEDTVAEAVIPDWIVSQARRRGRR